jgi:hypothetical protein
MYQRVKWFIKREKWWLLAVGASFFVPGFDLIRMVF